MKILLFVILSINVLAQDGRLDTLNSIDMNLSVIIRNDIDSLEDYTVSLLGSYDINGKEYHLKDTTIRLNRRGFENMYLEINNGKPYQYQLNDQNSKKYYVNSDEYIRTIFGIENYLKCVTKNVVYPKQAVMNKVEGAGVFRLFINEFGCIDFIESTSKLGSGIEEAGIMAINKCNCEFISGKIHKKEVPMIFFLPLKFKL